MSAVWVCRRVVAHAAAPAMAATVRAPWWAVRVGAACGVAGRHGGVRTAPMATMPGGSVAEADDDAAGTDGDDVPLGERGGRGGGGRGGGLGQRRGRPFLDPRAPRRQESIRSDPKHAKWGGMVDILEHNAYMDGQREEDPDGFFFDGTKAEYDSDCDGDPFSNGYLTEDEMEFDAEYEPRAYTPARVADQVHFLHTVRGYTIPQLCTKFRLSAERVSAMLLLKRIEPKMKATGRFSTKIDAAMQDLYGDRFTQADGSPSATENWQPDFDQGVDVTMLKDDQVPDDVVPVRRTAGNVHRVAIRLPTLPTPPKADRKHDSKFFFRSISGRKNNARTAGVSMVVSDYTGALRPATNVEALYRTWSTKHTNMDAVKSRSGLPYKDEDAHKPVSFRMSP